MKQPSVTVSNASTTLVKGKDYIIEGKGTDAGIDTLSAIGIGQYTGTLTEKFVIEKAAGSLKFVSSSVKKTYGDSAFTNGLSTKKTDGTVSFKSGNTSIATVDIRTGKVTIKGAGTVTITVASLPGRNYKTASTSYKLTVAKAGNAITASNVTKTYSTKTQSFSINAKVKDQAKLTYKSNTSKVSIDKNGKVTIDKKFVGKATITVKCASTNKYNACEKKITVTVNPSGAKISSISNTKGLKITVKWKKNTAATGYQIQYATDDKFSSNIKNVYVNKNSTTSKALSKLTKGTKYYVRIRTYKTVNGVNYYSAWSGSKNVTIKK